MEITPIKQNKMELTTTSFEYIYEQNYSDCDELHEEWLEDTTGEVDRYTDDDAHDDSLNMTVEYFMNLGYAAHTIAKVQDELWG
jgi:hypothetical protein